MPALRGDIFAAAAVAVAKVAVLAAAGWVLRRRGHITSEGAREFSQVHFQYFLPSLLFVGVVETVRTDELGVVALLTVVCCVQIALAGAVGFAVSRLPAARGLQEATIGLVALGNFQLLPVRCWLPGVTGRGIGAVGGCHRRREGGTRRSYPPGPRHPCEAGHGNQHPPRGHL